MAAEHKTVDLLRKQVQMANGMLEGVIAGITSEHVHWIPPGIANPIGAQYAHVLIGKDGFIHMRMKGVAALFATTWADKIGMSELPPMPNLDAKELPDWSEWARRVQIDLPAMQEYAKAVYASIDEYLVSLTDANLENIVDLSHWGIGEVTHGWMLSMVLLNDTIAHTGEISCLKGLQGLQGYPF